MSSSTALANLPVRIVLVGTSHPGNIGAVARAMKTMHLSTLRLVTPKLFPHAEATAMASGADDLLAAATVCATLEEAVEAFGRCIELDDDYLPAYVESGKGLRAAGDLAGAREMFAQAMERAAMQGETHVRDFVQQQLDGLPDDS